MRRTLVFLIFIISMLLIAWYFRDVSPLLQNPTIANPECQIAVASVADNENNNTCTVRIGIINTFSKDNSCHSGGEEHKRGYELALNEINSMGGINGCQVELVQIDDGDDSVAAGEAVITLVNEGESIEEQIPLILGAYSSSATLEAAETADDHDIPLIVPSASSAIITMLGYDWVFRLNADSDDYVTQAMAFTNTIDDTPTIAVLHENTLFGESAAVAIVSHAETEGIGVAAYEVYQKGDKSNTLTTSISTIKAANPDVVYLISNDINDSLKILEKSRELNFKPQLFIANAGAFVSPDFLDEASAAAEYVVVTAQWSDDVDWHYEGEGTIDASGFVTRFQDAYGGDIPGMRSVQTYTALRLAKEVIERAQNDSACNTHIKQLRTCIQKELRQVNLEQTLFGEINFDDDTGQNAHPVLLVQIVCDEEHDTDEDCPTGQFHLATVYPEEFRTQEVILPLQENTNDDQ